MKKIYSLLLVCFIINDIEAQVNLVPNPSFEEYSLCPGLNGGNANTLDYWDIDINTVDNFNSCDTNYPFNAGIPDNVFGSQCASLGNGYAGFFFYGSNGFEDAREMFGGSLSSPLVIGQKYFISYKVSSAESSYSVNNMLGLRFTNRNLINASNPQIILPPPFVDNAAHIFSTAIVSDTLGWTQIKGSFVSDSVYNNFLIGCFYTHEQIDTIVKPGFNFCKSYYYLDDVCISTDSLICENIKKQLINISADSNNINQNTCIDFNLQTIIDYSTYEWHFDGGFPNTSNLMNPINICYQNTGNFDVTFIGHKQGGCTDTLTLSQFINVDALTSSIDYLGSNKNPKIIFSDNVFKISKIDKNLDYSIVDVLGRLIKNGQQFSDFLIDCNNFNAGVYILTINNSSIKPIKFIIRPKSD